MLLVSCTYCNVDMHELCFVSEGVCCCGGKGFTGDLEAIIRKPRGHQPGEALRDVLSTGRHRAAVAIPDTYFATEPECAWARLAKAGGGPRPIIGCPGNIATDRHHGPDKSVLNNELGINLHAICSWCHNRWHSVNDKFYLPPEWKKGDDPRPPNGNPWLPVVEYADHDDVTPATASVIKLHEKWWGELSTADREELGGYFNDSPFGSRSEHSSSEGFGQGDSAGSDNQDADSDSGA